MQITDKRPSEHSPLIASLYTAVDALDADAVAAHVADDVRFRLGNFEPTTGRSAVRDGNAAFFATIRGMRHRIASVWSVDGAAICDGTVHYTRLDGSEHEVPFAAHLKVRDGRIHDYLVFVDISGL